MFYLHQTPSNDGKQYPIFEGGAMRYAHRLDITGSYADRRKPPSLIAVCRVRLFWVEG